MSPVRATARGAARTSLEGERADVLVCGASFGGLAVARALAGSGADVLLVDRYEIGERATSACAIPLPWVHALGLHDAVRSVLPAMTYTTPHGTVRHELPWSWAAFDYRELCRALFAQTDARFATAKVQGRTGRTVHTDRGDLTATHLVDALGWRRVLAADGYQPPEAPLSRGLEVHPHVDPDAADDALDVWVRRDLVRRGYGWRVPAGAEARVGVGSYDPRRHVREPTEALAGELDVDAVRYQGNWFPHRLREPVEDGVLFVGDSAGHCFALSGEGIRPALHFGLIAGAALRAALAEESTTEQAHARYAEAVATAAPAFRRAFALQRLVPALPPRALHLALRLIARPALARPRLRLVPRPGPGAQDGPRTRPAGRRRRLTSGAGPPIPLPPGPWPSPSAR